VKTDFLDAFFRHWEDAELLFSGKRWANASHLYGVATECGLKQLMVYFKYMIIDPVTEKPTRGADTKHVPDIWERYVAYQRGFSARTCMLPPINPFANWTMGQRYYHKENFDAPLVEAHRNGAITVKNLLDKSIK
jgi:hypothetical protein